ncbi:MAG: PHB depolymerase family esterase [Hyphomonadaceae bacterium]|nr:PHB depolymerase family esterase [Hyphomonadaceae bacterium]
MLPTSKGPLAGSRKLSFHEIPSTSPGAPPRSFFLYRPTVEIAGAPLVVSVHGIARNATAHAYRLIAEAERYGLCVLAPLFSKDAYGQYQQLIDAKSGARSDLALLDMLEALSQMIQADAARILLFGFSGGAQFAHRFAMAHPHMVRSAVLAAAGWYTWPTQSAPYPYGIDTTANSAELSFDLAAIATVPFHVMVGERDLERDTSLRASKRIDEQQGLNRVERATGWVKAMAALPFAANRMRPPELKLLPAVGHDFVSAVERADLTQRVFDCFAGDVNLQSLG